MFANSIEIAKGYTRCMKSIMRGYGSNEITRCCSTFIIVNDDGWVLTCKHIVEDGKCSLICSSNYLEVVTHPEVMEGLSIMRHNEKIY